MHISTMSNLNLIVLSYHEFYEEFDDYQFSRIYSKFRNDLETKIFDFITIDDAHYSSMKAFYMMKERNIRGLLFVPTALVSTSEKYLSWSQINQISKHHDIGNHSHRHIDLRNLTNDQIQEEILTANSLIEKHTGKRPRFFVPPFNKTNKHVDNIAEKLNLQIIRNRIDILNTTT